VDAIMWETVPTDPEDRAETPAPQPARTLAASDTSAARLKLAPSLRERLAAWLIPAVNPAGAIYGMITIGALLAAESELHETYPETVGSMAIALTMYWVAHAYANLLGERLQTQERLSAAALVRNLLHDWAIVRGASPPLLALVIAWAVGASQETAVTAALWTTVGSLLVYELAAGLRAKARPAELLLEGCVGAAIGLGVLALRVILH
jgi:hypothetical protein